MVHERPHGPPAAINRGPRNRPWTTMLRLSRNLPETLPRRRPSRRHRRSRPERPPLTGNFAGSRCSSSFFFTEFLAKNSPGKLAAGRATPTDCSSSLTRRPSTAPRRRSSPKIAAASLLCSVAQNRRSPSNAAAHRPTPPRSTTAIPSITSVAAALRRLPPAIHRSVALLLRPSTVTTCCWELQQAVGTHRRRSVLLRAPATVLPIVHCRSHSTGCNPNPPRTRFRFD